MLHCNPTNVGIHSHVDEEIHTKIHLISHTASLYCVTAQISDVDTQFT